MAGRTSQLSTPKLCSLFRMSHSSLLSSLMTTRTNPSILFLTTNTTNTTTTTITTNSTTITITTITTRIVETSTINNWSIPQERLLGTDLAAWGSPNGEWLAWAEINNSLVTSGEAEGCGGIQYNTYQYVQYLHNFAPLDESEYPLDVYLFN